MKRALDEVRIIFAVAWYNLKLTYRYPANVFFAIAMPIVFVAVGAIFAPLVGSDELVMFTGGEASLPLYMAAGLLMWLISNSSAGLAKAVEMEISWGTLSSNLQTPAPLASIFAGLALSNLLYGGTMSAIIAVPLLVLVPVQYPQLLAVNTALAIVLFLGVGMIYASLALLWKKVSGVIQVLSFVEQFFCGVFLPVRLIPVGLRWFAYALPQTWAIDGVRSALLGVEPIATRIMGTVILLVLATATNVAGLILLKRAERITRARGISDSY
ncbi:MAG: hypothetical protein DDT34_01982 [Firmicutes bacterium]|nr:hypothetical protein [Bacillota bacterium]